MTPKCYSKNRICNMYQYNTYHFSCNTLTPYTVFATHELYKDKGKKVTNLSSLKFVLAGFGVLKEAHACVSKVTKYVNVDISIGPCRWFLACVHLNLVHQYCNPNRSYSDYLAYNLHLKISKRNNANVASSYLFTSILQHYNIPIM